MYFLRRLRPLEVAGDRVRSLRVSLNTPVLSAADLPVGPARAVIVVHREARGRMDASVGVRSLRGGEVAYWSFDGDLESEADLDVAADAALTFSESLGFLFDEDALGAGAEAEKAFRTWLAGDDSGAVDPGGGSGFARRSAARDAEPPELELEDLVVDEPSPPSPARPARPERPAAPAPASRAPGPKAAAPPAPPAAKTLSKFRARDGEGSDTSSGGAGSKAPARQPLARLQLVKRRSPEEERKQLLRKLLTSF